MTKILSKGKNRKSNFNQLNGEFKRESLSITVRFLLWISGPGNSIRCVVDWMLLIGLWATNDCRIGHSSLLNIIFSPIRFWPPK